jgi:transcription antitermination factor NusG
MVTTELCWYALQVRPRYEKAVSTALKSKDVEDFLPLHSARRRWSDRIKEVREPLFQGYVFCRLNPAIRVPVLTIPGVVQIVGSGKNPTAIDPNEIAALQSVVRSGLPAKLGHSCASGSRCASIVGLFKKSKGFSSVSRDRIRLVVSVSLLQRSIAVEIDRDWVTPITTTRTSSFASLPCSHRCIPFNSRVE